MTAIAPMTRPRHTHTHSNPTSSAIPPLPEHEPVRDRDDPTLTGAIGEDLAVIDDTLALEVDMLTALLWAPPRLARAVTHALLGSPTQRADDAATDRLPDTRALFYRPTHRLVFDTAAELLDEGTPATPSLVQARLTDRGHTTDTRAVMLEIASPRYGRPVADSADLPHLTRAVLDAWYRRGYTALITRMTQATHDCPTADFAGHWDALTTHAHTAEQRWLTITDALARI